MVKHWDRMVLNLRRMCYTNREFPRIVIPLSFQELKKSLILVVEERSNVRASLLFLEKKELMDVSQKAKTKWDNKGDDNSKFYHGDLNKKKKTTHRKGC